MTAPNAIGRIALGLGAAALADHTFVAWSRWRLVLENWAWPEAAPIAAAITALTALALGLLVIAVVDPPRPSAQARAAALAAGAAAALVLAHRTAEVFDARRPTDTLVYADHAARLLLEGHNPYAASMAPALAEVPERHRTRILTGGFQDVFPYPGLHALLFVPGRALGSSPRATTLLFALALLSILAARPSPWGEIGTASLLVAHTFIPFSVGGSTDVVWAALLAGAAAVWGRPNHPAWRAVLVGLACAYKQSAWVPAPFLIVKVARDEGPEARRFIAVAAVAAAVSQLPFVVADPAAYVGNVVSLAAAPLRPIGAGPSLLLPYLPAEAGPVALRLAGAAVFVALAVGVWRSAALRGPAIWLLSPLALFFWPRFLQTYLVFFYPALVADLLRRAAGGSPRERTDPS